MAVSVVLAEDDDDLRFMYEYWLPDDWDVTTAANGEQALRAVDTTTDLLVLDRIMPEKTGDQVLDALDNRTGDCARIVVSAEPIDEQIITRTYDRYLRQPVTSEELVAAATDVLS